MASLGVDELSKHLDHGNTHMLKPFENCTETSAFFAPWPPRVRNIREVQNLHNLDMLSVSPRLCWTAEYLRCLGSS